jgi:hypothetical protein
MGETDREDVNIRNVATGESSGVVTGRREIHFAKREVALWVLSAQRGSKYISVAAIVVWGSRGASRAAQGPSTL